MSYSVTFLVMGLISTFSLILFPSDTYCVSSAYAYAYIDDLSLPVETKRHIENQCGIYFDASRLSRADLVESGDRTMDQTQECMILVEEAISYLEEVGKEGKRGAKRGLSKLEKQLAKLIKLNQLTQSDSMDATVDSYGADVERVEQEMAEEAKAKAAAAAKAAAEAKAAAAAKPN